MLTPTINHKTTVTNQRFFEDLGDGHLLEMVLVRGGTFTMGSPADEEERSDDEGPQHEVTVPTFFMGRYPVTQAQWRRVVQFDQVERELNPNPSRFKDREDSDRRPVEQVSWDDATEFCARLSAYLSTHTQRNYRLPSEAEWEYACRAGTTTPFYCGKSITTDIANYDGNYTYGRGPMGEYRGETTPVDYFQAMLNPLGLCDMHGNVREWCLDHWHENYYGAPSDGSVWIEGCDRDFRVYRGGSWGSSLWNCRSAYRDHYAPDDRSGSFGFRVVLAPRSTLQSRQD